jgi:hypothetical protein
MHVVTFCNVTMHYRLIIDYLLNKCLRKEFLSNYVIHNLSFMILMTLNLLITNLWIQNVYVSLLLTLTLLISKYWIQNADFTYLLILNSFVSN